MTRFFRSLFGQVVAALVLGVALGALWPEVGVALKPLGDLFIKLIKFAIAPLVFGVVVNGIVGAGDLKKVGRVGLKSLIYFEAVTTVALALGIVLAYVFQPGAGMNVNTATLDGSALAGYSSHVKEVTGFTDFIMRLVPTTFIDAFAKGDVLQVLIIAILFGAGLSLLGDRGKPLADSIERITEVLFKIIGIIVKLAPLGVLGAVSFTVAKYGIGSLKQLGLLVGLFYV
ncbi:cation:dicarboxylase symporter family transporter, partial [Rhodopseudomonas sp. BR0C11]|uniref:cation:dicarboxylate symporter family transporter n=1 Tax=Rhodopseudomonas sp. BR0C11 TaxID=2269370 RepID=UPI0013DFA73D